MTLDAKTVDGRQVCIFSGELTIWEAADTWARLQPLLTSKSKTPVDFDLSAITACDGAGIQILCQIERAVANSKDKRLVAGLSEQLTAILRYAGKDFAQPAQPSEEK